MAVINTRMVVSGGDTPYAIIQNMLVIPFRVKDPQKLQAIFLPPPLQPVEDGDIGWVCFTDTVLPALRDGGDGEPPDPDLTEFREIAVGMPCMYNGEIKSVFPEIGMDRPTAGFRRGILRNIAYTQITQFHPLLKGRRAPGPGSQIVGITNRPHGEMVARGILQVTREEAWECVPEALKHFLHMRYIADPTRGGKPIAADFTDCVFDKPLEGAAAWRGETKLKFGEDYYNRFRQLGDYESLEGYYLTIAYCYGSDRKVADMEGRRPWQWC